MRVVIADDEPLGRLALRQLVASHRDVEIVGEACDGNEAIELVRTKRPDVLLLDIQMPEVDGFDVLAELGSAVPPTIFVTAYDAFAVKAFEAHALDYLVKPVGQPRFDAALARVRDAIARDDAAELGKRIDELLAGRGALERIVARLGDRSTVISVAEIDWIEAQDYCAAVHVGTATHVVRQTLAALETRLDARRFVRIHRSALVNVARIRELRHETTELVVVLASGERLPVSRRRRDALERMLGIAG
jgi:two-component system, LytTR family, response regulator